MSIQPPSGAISKAAVSASKSSLGGGSNLSSPAASQTQQFFSNDLGSTRRSGSTPNARSSPAPRSSQTSKPKHKQGKRFRALDEDAEAEAFSMQNPHGRRGQQSITHLMQFALPPRPNAQTQHHRHSYNGPRRSARVNQTWGLGSGYHAGDKARYVHANYRFIVDPSGDYHAQAQDADVHLEWNNILQIIVSSKTQEASCPICLGEPTAPRMAKCGHIFCLPCLIRYMHSEDGNAPPPERRARWKKCPICWDSIYVTETKPVRWYVGQENEPLREGDDVVLRLVKRKPESTLAMPRESAETLAKGDIIPWYFVAEVMDYARVMKGSEEYMLQQYDEALAAVEQQEKEDELMFGEDTEWTGRAIRMLKEAREKVKGIGNPPAQPKKPEPAEVQSKPDRPPIQFNDNDDNVPPMYLESHANVPPAQRVIEEDETAGVSDAGSTTEEGQAVPASTNNVPRTLTEMRQRHTEKPQPSEYLFYQGLLHYYLSPLDIRILKTAFGSYSLFPSSILPRVERVSSGHVVDDDLRKRIKYLSHLPYGCEVAFLECDWRDVVPATVLDAFRPMLERRRRRNEEKDAREEKERVRIEKAEERELASIRRRRPSIPNADDFFTTSSFPPASLISGAGGVDLPASSSSPPWNSSAHQRPGFTSLASPSTSPSVQRTVWGTAVVAPSSPEMHAGLPSDHAFRHEDDGWLQGWEQDLLDFRQQEDLAAGFEGLSVQASSSGSGGTGLDIGKAGRDIGGASSAMAPPTTGPGTGGGKKGKKGKKITLMSTATARRGA